MIVIKNLTKRYDDQIVLNNVSLNINDSEIIGIIGPSGSGKSTIVSCINGLESYELGDITVNTEHKYEIGTVFQDFNLFENMTVLENVSYAQQTVLKKTKNDANCFSMAMLQKIDLVYSIDRYPHELSGGQKQRIAIARTLCMSPKVILFDEPTSALDPESISDVLGLIKSIAQQKITMIIVTHEIRFAKAIATRMIFMDKGKIEEDLPTHIFFYESRNIRLKTFLDKLLSH